jgi:hypothetical protein
MKTWTTCSRCRNSGRNPQPSATGFTRSFMLRGQDRAIWVSDAEKRTYSTTNLGAQLELALSEFRRTRTFPVPGGRQVPLFATTSIKVLPDRSTLDGVELSGFKLATGEQTWRIWVAMKLPRAPMDAQRAIVQMCRWTSRHSESWAGSPAIRSCEWNSATARPGSGLIRMNRCDACMGETRPCDLDPGSAWNSGSNTWFVMRVNESGTVLPASTENASRSCGPRYK